MKKYITPENFILIHACLFAWENVFIEYKLRPLATIFVVLMVLNMAFFIGSYWRGIDRERRELEQRLG